MSILRALPLALFPPVHWWIHALQSDVRLDSTRTYQKQTLRNRFAILTSNGPQILSVPVRSTHGQALPHSSIRLGEGKWRLEHLHAIRSAYGRAAYFEHYYPIIEKSYAPHFQYLHEMAHASQMLLNSAMQKKAIPAPLFVQGSDSIAEESSRLLSQTLEPTFLGIQEPGYPQVFSDRFAFHSNLSYIDLMMNKGPQAIDYILFIKNTEQGSSFTIK